ncbi:MAG: hypothetical protein U5Q16_03710 [Gammaproteobacteria bacterium]|nr:hypothetical protein [Gammaproteobacteria bacterium]
MLLSAASCLPGLLLAAETARDYDLAYQATFQPDTGCAQARITVRQESSRLRLLDFNAPSSRYSEFSGDGEITRQGRRVLWQVPAEGGEIRYRVRVKSQRSGDPDARMTADWAVARLDDLFPPARSRSRRGTSSRASLTLAGPEGWSFETPYGPVDGTVDFDTAGRRLDRPLGWLAAGDLGIRRSTIAGRRVAIAGPRDQGFRRMDLLAFLHWTLPELVAIAPSLPRRVLIVGAGRDMWRGGLSGPGSLYLHPDRPLLSGNATSPVLHELMHVAMTQPPADGDDWIVEGVAEYYGLVILLRSGGISGDRFERALDWHRDWAQQENGRLAHPSTGPDTARAVLLFRDLQLELAAAGECLDPVVAELLQGSISRERLAGLLEARLGRPSAVLSRVLESGEVPQRR